MKTRKLVTKSNSIHGRNFVNISILQLLPSYIYGYILDILRQKKSTDDPCRCLSVKSTFALIYIRQSFRDPRRLCLLVKTHTAVLLLRGTDTYVWTCTGKVNIHVSCWLLLVERFKNRLLNWYAVIHTAWSPSRVSGTYFSSFMP